MSPRWQRSWVPASSPPWGIPWAAWSPSWCTSGTPRCCRVWCCAQPRATWGPRHRQLAAFALPAAAAGLRWNPVLQLVSAEVLGSALLGPIDDPATARWARAQLRLTTLASAVSAIRAVCEFSSDRWIGQVDVPAAVVVTTRDRIVPVGRQLQLAQAIPGAALHRVDADHAVCITAPQVFAPMLLEACQAVQASSVPADQRLSVA